MRHLLLLLCVLGLQCGEGPMPMRDRVYADPVSGLAFRCPYAWTMPDQYRAEFLAPGERAVVIIDGVERQIERRPADANGKAIPVVRVVGALLDGIPGGVAASAPLADQAAALAGPGYVWTTVDYYRTPSDRPQATATWAPLGVDVVSGATANGAALAVRHNGRIDVLLAALPATDPAVIALFDSVEIMAHGAKPAAKFKAGPRFTWREGQWKKGLVTNAKGVSIKPGKAGPDTAWADAWEVETAHYHVTGNRDPRVLLERAAQCEALFQAYVKIFEPEVMPPVKFEVHCFNTAGQYEAAVRQWFDPGFKVRDEGGINGGFFVPSFLALWLYEESGDLGGPDMDIMKVAAHEASHQFLHMACNGSGHVPTWFNEGLAVYFENGVFRGAEFTIRSPSGRVEALRSIYEQRKRTIWPMEKYLDYHGRIEADQYAEVYAMVHLWVFGTCVPSPSSCRHASCGLKRFRDYWHALKRGEDGTEAFTRIFLVDLIAAQGGREAALRVWERLLLEHVAKRLK
jgi:hypothetical protein